MIKNYRKLCLIILTTLFAYSFAASKFETKFKGITEAKLNNDDGPAFKSGGNKLDNLDLVISADVDNVSAQVKLETDKGDDVIKFSSAYLEVKDVLDGLLTFKFYDIGYGTGKKDVIRADLGAHGIKVTVKPIDLLSISVGYGINNDQLINTKKYTALTDQKLTFNGDYHAVTLDVGVNLDILPFTISAGAVLADRSSQREYNNGAKTVYVDAAGNTKTNTGLYRSKASKLLLMQAGISMDALAAIMPGALKIDFGATFAGTGIHDPIKTVNKVKGINDGSVIEMQTALAMAVILHGGVPDLVAGLGLDYYLHFSPDRVTKYQSLGDLDDDVFAELIKVSLTPSYTLGQFKFALGLGFKRYGINAARYFKQITGKDKALLGFNALDIDPSVTWTPATGMSVKFYYGLDFILGGDALYAVKTPTKNLVDEKDAIDHKIGMKVELALSVASE